MAKDALNKVIQAEEFSKNLIKKTQKELDIKLQNTKISAKNMIEKHIKQNKQNYDDQITNYIKQSQKIKKDYEKIINSKCCELENLFNINSKKAVDAVINQLIQNVEV